MPKHHELKTWPAYYQEVVDGNKRFEIRDDRDRSFQKGDTVTLREWRPKTSGGTYTGRQSAWRITYVTSFGQKEGMVVLGIQETTDADQEQSDA